MRRSSVFYRLRLLLGLGLLAAVFSNCAAMPAHGPSRREVQRAETSDNLEGITLVNVDDAFTRRLMAAYKIDRFSDVFSLESPLEYLVLPGDVVEVAIWEAPPPMLFGSAEMGVQVGTKATRAETLPPQMVMEDGQINMPFVGRIAVAGRSVRMIEDEITERLKRQANKPQVIVRVVENNASRATVIGDTARSTQIPLTPKGERLLDAIAGAGGIAHPVTRMSVQLSRKSATAAMPLDLIIRDPAQNILLMPGDVVTALFQPKSFSVFGAAGSNQEIPFEAQGISLAQALARSGGLNESRSDERGVFLFRFENARLLADDNTVEVTGGTKPVVYRVDFRDPASFFVTQNFPVQDRDVIYVANATAAELEKFLRLVGIAIAPAINTTVLIKALEK